MNASKRQQKIQILAQSEEVVSFEQLNFLIFSSRAKRFHGEIIISLKTVCMFTSFIFPIQICQISLFEKNLINRFEHNILSRLRGDHRNFAIANEIIKLSLKWGCSCVVVRLSSSKSVIYFEEMWWTHTYVTTWQHIF